METKLTTIITLNGRREIRFTETGAEIIGPGNGGSYLHLSDEQADLPPPSEALARVLARYRMTCAAAREILGISHIQRGHPDYFLEPGLGASVCRWAHSGLSPDAVAKMAGLTSTPAVHLP